MDPIMDSNNKVCRACLGCCPQEYYSLDHGTPSYRFKLQECVPFMDFNVIHDPIICVTCAAMLDRSYQLLIVARNVESRLSRYMKECCCVGACYIMAHKPVDGLLDCLKYHTIVDDAYNFRMVVAMAAKVEAENESTVANQGEEMMTLGRIIKVEDFDKDYDETEMMPDIHLISPLPSAARERSPSPVLIPFLPVHDRSSAFNSPVSSDIDNHDKPPSPIQSAPSPALQRKFVFVPTHDVNTTINQSQAVPYKIIIKSKPAAAPTNNKCRNVAKIQECPICHKLFGNLTSHLRVHANNGDTVLAPPRGVVISMLAQTIQCVQCCEVYKKADVHKCLFSSYVRLERIQSLNDLARTYRRMQMSRRKCSKQRTVPPFGDDNAAAAAASVCPSTFKDTVVGNSLTLSALSAYDEDEACCGGQEQQVFRCVNCQLRLDNAVQLTRHSSLNHDAHSQNLIDRLNPTSVFDEHSYAWIKTIQCWNCSRCFSSRENWLTHDFREHRSSFLICYVCFRGYKHSQIIAHMTNTHGLPMDETNFFRMLNYRKYLSARSDDVNGSILLLNRCIVDDTYTRMTRFIMLEYKMIHCPLCQRPCGNTSLLIRHLVLNRCTKSACLLCHAELDSTLHLIDHLMRESHRRNVVCATDRIREMYMCQVCDSVFKLETAFYSHCCFDDNNPFVVYKHKMGLWSCAECLIMSPFGMTAKLQHVSSAVHMRHRLDRLANSTATTATIITDLNCHLCTETTAFTSRSLLLTHLVSFHVERLSVLCPLCHYMALNPEGFARHLEAAHPEFPLSQSSSSSSSDSGDVVSVATTQQHYPDEFTCLLCSRSHWTLNSFWRTCGQGHGGCTFPFAKILEYLEMFDDERWLQFNNGDTLMYNCECGRMIRNGRQLYEHHRGLPGDSPSNLCSFWAYCDVCCALVSPRNKLAEHANREHLIVDNIPPRIRCKDPNELLLKVKDGFGTVPLLGKRKRRKTQLFLEMEENGGLLAMDKKLEKSIEEYNRAAKRPRSRSSSSKRYVEFNVLRDADKIKEATMQPFVQLEKMRAPPLPGEVVIVSTVDNATLHMIEAIERVAAYSGEATDAFYCDFGDDDRSSCSSELLMWDNPDKFKEEEIQEMAIGLVQAKSEDFNVILSNSDSTENFAEDFLRTKDNSYNSESGDEESISASDSDVISDGGCLSTSTERTTTTKQVNPCEKSTSFANTMTERNTICSEATVSVQQQKKRFRCSLCTEICADMDLLIVHMKANHFEEICCHCDDKFPNAESLSRHLEICLDALRNRELNRIIFHNNITERSCDDDHQNRLQPTRHLDDTLNNSMQYYSISRCLDCDLLLPGFFVAREHFVHFHGNAVGQIYSCHMCDAFAVQQTLMKQHKELHKDSAFKCIVCGRVFAMFIEYKLHYDDHKMASCPHCPRMFLDVGELRMHISILHRSSPKET